MNPALTDIELTVLREIRRLSKSGLSFNWLDAHPQEVQAARRLVKKGKAVEHQDERGWPYWLPKEEA